MFPARAEQSVSLICSPTPPIRDDLRQFNYRPAKRRILHDLTMKVVTVIVQLLAQPLKAVNEMIDFTNRLN